MSNGYKGGTHVLYEQLKQSSMNEEGGQVKRMTRVRVKRVKSKG